MSHTPGPWTVKPITEDFGCEIVSAEGLIARTWWVSHPEGTPVPSIPNGHLIAAAPELLEALRECAPALARFGYDSESVQKAFAAIAKAEGKEHEVQKK